MSLNFVNNIFARNGTLENIPSTPDTTPMNFDTGFIASTELSLDNGGIPLSRGQFNSMLYLITEGLAELQQHGGFLWKPDISYNTGDEVCFIYNGITQRYRSLVNDNLGHSPDSDTSLWLAVSYYAPFPTASSDIQIGGMIATVIEESIANSMYPKYIRCKGQSVLRQGVYEQLYTLLVSSGQIMPEATKEPTQFGDGDGQTTFTLPNLTNIIIGNGTDHATNPPLSSAEIDLSTAGNEKVVYLNWYVKYKE